MYGKRRLRLPGAPGAPAFAAQRFAGGHGARAPGLPGPGAGPEGLPPAARQLAAAGPARARPLGASSSLSCIRCISFPYKNKGIFVCICLRLDMFYVKVCISLSLRVYMDVSQDVLRMYKINRDGLSGAGAALPGGRHRREGLRLGVPARLRGQEPGEPPDRSAFASRGRFFETR